MSSINWWLDFFADAGIPPNSAAEYAVAFAEQRIPQEYEIILELGKEEWHELGVTVLGDRLAMKTLAKTGGKAKKVMIRPKEQPGSTGWWRVRSQSKIVNGDCERRSQNHQNEFEF